MNSEIYHCVFTHATDGRSGSGGRFETVERSAGDLLPAEALIELQSFLGKLMPESKTAPAFAMRRFSGGTERYACFMVSYSGFQDSAGRNGLVNHARVVRLERDALWFDPLPLVDMAESFPIAEVLNAEPLDRLQAYLQRLATEDVVTVRRLSRQELKSVPRDLLRQTLLTTLGAIGDPRGRRRVAAPDAPLTQLARAWAALPVGLQRRSAWAHGATEGLPVQLTWSREIESTKAERPSDAALRTVDQYLALLDSSYDLNQLVSDEQLDLPTFTGFVQKASATVATQPETREMTKKTTQSEPRPRGRAGLDSGGDNNAAELNRQYDRMFEALREYVDLRLDGYEAGRAAARVNPRGGDVRPAAGFKGVLDRYGIAIAALVAGILLTLGVLALTGVLKWGGKKTADPVDAQTETAQTTQEQQVAFEEPPPDAPPRQASAYLTGLIANTEKTKNWPQAFLDLSETEPNTVSRLIDDAWAHGTTGPETRVKLAQLRARMLGTGPKLERTDREALRKYLLQYIAAEGDDSVKIDDSVTDVKAAVVKRLKDETKAKTDGSNPSDADLQSEIILRWLEKHPL